MNPLVLTLLCLSSLVAVVFTVLSYKKTLLNLYLKTIASTLFVLLGIASLYCSVTEYIYAGVINDELIDKLIGGFLIITALIFCLIGDNEIEPVC